MKLIIRNVTVVNATGREVKDVFAEDGVFVKPFEGADMEVSGTGKFLLPGFIDGHVHFREPGETQKETWETGSEAALLGGVTTVLDMPNNKPAISSVAALEEKQALVKGRSHVNYGFHFGASADLDELRKVSGVAGIKIYMGSSTGDLLVSDPLLWEEIFKIAKEKNLPVIIHAEDEARIQQGLRDCECARVALEAALNLQAKVGNRLHLAHMSCQREVELIRSCKDSKVTCEVAPHHLFFTEADKVDDFLRVNPPLRSQEDVRILWEALRDGTVTCLATDHAPHTREDKQSENPPAGLPGVQFLLPLMLNEVNQNMISLERLVQLGSQGPARVFGLHKKGAIEVGMDADAVLVDMDLSRKINNDLVKSKCGWTPYDGYELKGWPVMTFVNGELGNASCWSGTSVF